MAQHLFTTISGTIERGRARLLAGLAAAVARIDHREAAAEIHRQQASVRENTLFIDNIRQQLHSDLMPGLQRALVQVRRFDLSGLRITALPATQQPAPLRPCAAATPVARALIQRASLRPDVLAWMLGGPLPKLPDGARAALSERRALLTRIDLDALEGLRADLQCAEQTLESIEAHIQQAHLQSHALLDALSALLDHTRPSPLGQSPHDLIAAVMQCSQILLHPITPPIRAIRMAA